MQSQQAALFNAAKNNGSRLDLSKDSNTEGEEINLSKEQIAARQKNFINIMQKTTCNNFMGVSREKSF